MATFEEKMMEAKARLSSDNVRERLTAPERLELARDVLKSAIQMKSWDVAEEAFVILREALLDTPTKME